MNPRSSKGQALLELGLCAPVVILLVLGSVAAVQIAAARYGLDAATQEAANAAARAADPTTAVAAARGRFALVVADYPLGGPTLSVSIGGFDRGGEIVASSSGFVDIGWAPLLLLPSHVTLQSQVVLRLEPWRTHRH